MIGVGSSGACLVTRGFFRVAIVAIVFGAASQVAWAAEPKAAEPREDTFETWRLPPDYRPAARVHQERIEEMRSQIERVAATGRHEQAQKWREGLAALEKKRVGDYQPGKSDRPELHVVGVYEGEYPPGVRHQDARGRRNRGHANLSVTYTGAPVVLVLSSYEPVMWDIRAARGVKIEKVVLASYYGSDAVAPDGVVVVGRRKPDDQSGPYVGYEKRALASPETRARLTEMGGLEPRTMIGVYNAKEEMVVGPENQQWRDEYLLSETERLYREVLRERRQEWARDLMKVRFRAVHYAFGDERKFDSGHASLAEFTPLGPITATMRPLTKGYSHVAHDAVSGGYWAIDHHSVVGFDPKTSRQETLTFGPELEPLSWPCGLTFDSRRRRLMLASLGGTGFLYAFDVDRKKWTQICDLGNRDLSGLAYDPKSDTLLGFQAQHGEKSGGVNTLIKMNAQGGIVESLTIMPPIPVSEHRPRLQAIVADAYLLVMTQGGRSSDGESSKAVNTLYVIDPKSGRQLFSVLQQPQAIDRGGAGTGDVDKLKRELERVRGDVQKLTEKADELRRQVERFERPPAQTGQDSKGKSK